VRDTTGPETIFYFGGGGQGNHFPGGYAAATMRALGAVYRSNALAQEKTGEFWVNGRMMGAPVRGDFEHAEVALFVGKNPYQSHGMPRARVTLKEIAKDPARALIVIDPRRSETARHASVFLQPWPGEDAALLAGLLRIILDEDWHDAAFCADACYHPNRLSAMVSLFGIALLCCAGYVRRIHRATWRRKLFMGSVCPTKPRRVADIFIS